MKTACAFSKYRYLNSTSEEILLISVRIVNNTKDKFQTRRSYQKPESKTNKDK